jgi:hypothetical protein
MSPSSPWIPLFARALRHLKLGAALATLCLVNPVWAHHGSSLGRVGDNMASAPGTRALADDPLPRLELSLDSQLTSFHRALLGSAPYTEAQLGSVTLLAATWGIAFETESRTRVALLLPAGRLTIERPATSARTEFGLGDLQLSLQQQLWAVERSRRTIAELVARVGVIAPSGNYDPEARLSLIDASGLPDGSFALISYDNQASLGSGAWSLSSGVEASWKIVAPLELRLHLDFAAPVTRTKDDIRWGYDFRTGPSVRFAPLLERLGVSLGIDYARHAAEEITLLDDETLREVRESVGGRQEIALRASLDTRLARTLSCGVGARLPLWQRTVGVQLVAAYNLQAGCAWSLNL